MIDVLDLSTCQTSPGSRPASRDDDLMRELLQSARAAWPEVEVEPEVFAAYLNSRVPAGADSHSTLSRMRTSDLYLACACARGNPRAILAFERCLGIIDETLPRMAGVDSDIVDEVKQRLRRRLLVAEGGPPGILEFSGRGELRFWLRVLAVRDALALSRRAGRETPADERVLERALVPAADPELQYLKKLYQSEFASAVADALQRLSAREQTLLRQSFVDGLSIDQLGVLHRVHRATAARWLATAQRTISRETKELLMRRLKVGPAELHSILRFLRSGFQMSLRRLFRARRRPRDVRRPRRSRSDNGG